MSQRKTFLRRKELNGSWNDYRKSCNYPMKIIKLLSSDTLGLAFVHFLENDRNKVLYCDLAWTIDYKGKSSLSGVIRS